mmetsp:Transcript_22392/g.37452  ORF Transcript_22392/g.37452 Transcript_22392/m.37452 type:complete len:158 (+) Transcript_22392:76-549(+)
MCGLSRKQMWRRQPQQFPVNLKNAAEVAKAECVPKEVAEVKESSVEREASGENEVKAASENVVEEPDAESVPMVEASAKAKKVSFNLSVGVILIPCIKEYKEAQIFDCLWWNPKDFKVFQGAAASAFRQFMLLNALSDKKKALKLFILEQVREAGEA